MPTSKYKLCVTALSIVALPALLQTARAAEFYVRAGVTTVSMPDPLGGPAISVPMWGYSLCAVNFTTCDAVTVPGPALSVASSDTTGLTVHLRNDLGVPTSLVINGLFKAMTPVWDNGATGNRPTPAARVRSFDAEAAASGGLMDYTWPNAKPGTYLYQSGTQAQVQVQMGLYGALTKNAVDAAPSVRAQAYAGLAYDDQATLLYSEIDPALHDAVGGPSPTYGTPAGPTSTLDYAPKYFLINGQPYPITSVVPRVGNAGTTLLRLLNAGLTTHVPMIQGTHWSVIAEDGKPYMTSVGGVPTPIPKVQYTALLPAAKTQDVLLTPDIAGGVYPIIDRRLSLSNNGMSDGGMLAFLQYGVAGEVNGGTPAQQLTDGVPVALNDSYSALLGVSLNVGTNGVLANDSDPDNLPQPIKAVPASGATTRGGSYTLHANGSFSYSPPALFSPPDSVDTFTYKATDGKWLSNLATVSIQVDTPALPAPALLDNFVRDVPSTGLGADWSQVVATDPPQPNLQVVDGKANAVAVDLGGQAIWVKDTDPGSADTSIFGATQSVAITSDSLVNSSLILKASGGTAAASPANFVRVRHEGTSIVVYTLMGGSNASVYVKQASLAASSNSGTLSARVDDHGVVTVFLNADYVGGVQLPDVGVWKGPGRIGMQIQAPGATVTTFSGGST